MLFDLQSRGRRRFVKVIYLGLAVLMGGGLLLFGIGTGTNQSGFFDLLSNHNGGATGQVSSAEKRADRAVRLNPRNAPAWATLARLRFQGAEYDSQKQEFTAKGKKELASASQAWQRYLALNPPHPDPAVARMMATAYSETALNQAANAADALEIVAAADPSAPNYAALAQYAYTAGELRKGDLASAKAIQLAPKLQRSLYKRQLAAMKKKALQGAGKGAVQSGSTAPSG
jgi:tetratricopeptide (TPR) repeat protein